MKPLRWICLAFFLLLALAPPAAAAPLLRRGINVLGYDPIWQEPAKARFKARHFRAIRQAGFDFIRVNLLAFRHMKGSGELDKAWLKRLDWDVHEGSAAGLSVILDEHDFNACSDDPATCRIMLGS